MNYKNFKDAFDLWTPDYIEYNDENVMISSFNPNKDVKFNLLSMSLNSGDLDISIDLDNLIEIKTHQSVLTFSNKKDTRWIDLDFEDEYSMNSFLDVYNNGL